METDKIATTEGMYSSIMNGLLIGFLLPLPPALFWREHPHPNFFDADAEAISEGRDWVGTQVASATTVGGGLDDLPCSAFSERVQVSPLPLRNNEGCS